MTSSSFQIDASLALYLKLLTMIRTFVQKYDFPEVRREDLKPLAG